MAGPAAAERPEADGRGVEATGVPLEEEGAVVGAAEGPGGAAGAPPLADGSTAGGPPPGLAAASSFPIAVAGAGAVGAWGSESGLP